MTIERELLQKVVNHMWQGELVDEIKELLTQPEQTEQEPVAWMWTRNYEGGGYTNKVFEFLNDAEEYAKDSKTLKSPDIICPLYTARPIHEPLSVDKLDVLAEANITDEGIAGYYLGFRDAEKCHGIGGGE